MFDRALQSAGYETELISDGKSALERLDQVSPQLVLLDLNLPQVSGVQIWRHMRKCEHLRETWIILATANAVQAGFIEDQQEDDRLFTLLKPVSFEQLIRLVSALKGK
jgi:CheY-like chemotaxis protein